MYIFIYSDATVRNTTPLDDSFTTQIKHTFDISLCSISSFVVYWNLFIFFTTNTHTHIFIYTNRSPDSKRIKIIFVLMIKNA